MEGLKCDDMIMSTSPGDFACSTGVACFLTGEGEKRAGVFCFDGEKRRLAGEDINADFNGECCDFIAEGGNIVVSTNPRFGDCSNCGCLLGFKAVEPLLLFGS